MHLVLVVCANLAPDELKVDPTRTAFNQLLAYYTPHIGSRRPCRREEEDPTLHNECAIWIVVRKMG